MQAGVFAEADPMLTAEAVWAAMHGITTLLLDQADHLKSAPAALVAKEIDIIAERLVGVNMNIDQ